jgi:GNAT superfamily N-acetyltransferase
MPTLTAPCEYLPWDSAFFGTRIARVLPPVDYPALDAWCAAEQIQGVYLYQDADDVAGIVTAEDHGFRLMDVRVIYDGRTDVNRPPPDSPAIIRPLRPEDVPALMDIAGRSHQQTRFYADPHFGFEKCAELYRIWLEKSCTGWAQHVIVAELDGSPCGYMTIHVDSPTLGRLALLAVDDRVRGQGVGSLIVHASLRWLADQRIPLATWPTSARNIGAQRLCTAWGFRLRSAGVWHHRWI